MIAVTPRRTSLARAELASTAQVEAMQRVAAIDPVEAFRLKNEARVKAAVDARLLVVPGSVRSRCST